MTTSPAFPPLVQVSMVKVVTPSSAPARLPLPSSVNSLLSPRPSSASSSRSTSPAPAQKRKRVDQPSKPKKRPAEKRIKELDVVTTPPSRSASPFTRPKAVPRSVAAPAPDLPVEHIDAARVVRESPKGYEPFLTDLKDPSRTALEWAGSEIPQVELEYPVVGVRETFPLVQPKPIKGDRVGLWQPIEELMQTITLMLDCYLTPQQALEHFEYSQGSKRAGLPLPSMSILGSLERAHHRRDGPGLIAAVKRFNVAWSELREKGVVAANVQAMDGVEERVWQHISGQAYDRAVAPRAECLNRYQAWSSNIYGELLSPFVAEIVHITGLKPGMLCVDLGSGVGNCLIQASLASGCESVGFENMLAASQCATLQLSECQARWKMWGVSAGEVKAFQADFIKESSLVVPYLERADVIICNNFVFVAELNDAIVHLLLDAKDGAQVVHLKPFAPATTERSLDSPAAILRQGPKRRWARQSVSWTDVEGEYYVSTIDRVAYQKRVEEAMARTSMRRSASR